VDEDLELGWADGTDVDGAEVFEAHHGMVGFGQGLPGAVYRYRYTASIASDGGLQVYCEHYPVIRRTKAGAWIDDVGRSRFVLDGDGKRFAHETREMALRSFHRRSVWRQRHARRSLSIGALSERWAALQLKKGKDNDGTAR